MLDELCDDVPEVSLTDWNERKESYTSPTLLIATADWLTVCQVFRNSPMGPRRTQSGLALDMVRINARTVGRDARAARALSALPGPAQTKAAAVPGDDPSRAERGRAPPATRARCARTRPKAGGPRRSDARAVSPSVPKPEAGVEARESRVAARRGSERANERPRAWIRRWASPH